MPFSAATYVQRRVELMQKVGEGLILLLGNENSPRNYLDNYYLFRQDSTFLYYGGPNLPHYGMLLDPATGKTTLFGNDAALEAVVWTGPQDRVADLAAQTGIEQSGPYYELVKYVRTAVEKGVTIHFLPPYRAHGRLKLSAWLKHPISKLGYRASKKLIQAVVAQRAVKSEEELQEMELAVDISREMHLAAIQNARPGDLEAKLVGLITGIARSANGDLAYTPILTVNGQILHNHHYHHTLEEGRLVLGDFGAESPGYYAGDITRTFPVDKKFTDRQKAGYEIVLHAQEKAIQALKPGVAYRDIHLLAAKELVTGLKDLGLMKGDPEEAVVTGAHALFFPHGLGHMIGLDVHDMEDLGEDNVGYDDQIRRSDQFGLKALRLGRKLEAGFVITVEPGLYFIPQLIDQWAAEKKYEHFIQYDALGDFRDFGGIRIEDDIVITENGHRILGKPIPKTVAEIEDLRG